MRRPWLLLSVFLISSAGCPDTEPSEGVDDDDDSGSSTGNTTDPSTTLPPTTDPATTDPTTDPGTTTDESTTGSTTDEGSSSSGVADGSSSGTGSSTGEGSSSSTGEPCEFLLCDGVCVDPDTNADFCGATECEGKGAGVVCSGSGSCVKGECVESCDNCSFETGDFTDWTVVDMAEPFLVATVLMDGEIPGGGKPPAGAVAPSGLGLAGAGAAPFAADYGFGVLLPPVEGGIFFGPVTATDGTFVAVNGFDGAGPDEVQYGQDITLRDEATTLEFDYRAAWDMLGFKGSTLDRVFEVRIEPEGGGKPMDTIEIETAAAGTMGDTGVVGGTVDVSGYAGQTVFINFVWVVPEDFTGPAQAELDNIRVLVE